MFWEIKEQRRKGTVVRKSENAQTAERPIRHDA
jgi:hypothetical protein